MLVFSFGGGARGEPSLQAMRILGAGELQLNVIQDLVAVSLFSLTIARYSNVFSGG
jgi:hypothetical protein